MQRGKDGKFIKGNKGGPGRKPLAAELPFMDQLKKEITPQQFGRIIQKLAALSERGNLDAVKILLSYLVGNPVSKTEVSGANGTALTIRVIYDDGIIAETTEAA